jgi:hypothetical protein
VADGDSETIFFGAAASFTVPFLAVTLVGKAAAGEDADVAPLPEPDAAGDEADFEDEHPAASSAETAITPTAARRGDMGRRELTRSAPPADPRSAQRAPVTVMHTDRKCIQIVTHTAAPPRTARAERWHTE